MKTVESGDWAVIAALVYDHRLIEVLAYVDSYGFWSSLLLRVAIPCYG